MRSTALERACERRFPAWTLYARAFTGSRGEAEYVVRDAVSRALHSTREFATEAEAHQQVLSSIRAAALRSSAHGKSVLGLLHESGGREVPAAARSAVWRLQQMPRAKRRAVERVLLGRPPSSIESVARGLGVRKRSVVAELDSGLRQIAAGLSSPADSLAEDDALHPDLESLVDYVEGSLTGEQARALGTHALACASCGDRLGTMMLLKAASSAPIRIPRVPRSHRPAVAALVFCAVLASGAWVVERTMPNPWKEFATSETVPRWFYDFFDRSGDSWTKSDTAKGLALLVEGRFDEAIEVLEPVVDARPSDAEASTYLGVARFLEGDTSRVTVRLLEAGTSSSRSGRLARWYLASVWLARGDVGRAIVHLEALAATGDWFGRSAERLLKVLEDAKHPPRGIVAGRLD